MTVVSWELESQWTESRHWLQLRLFGPLVTIINYFIRGLVVVDLWLSRLGCYYHGCYVSAIQVITHTSQMAYSSAICSIDVLIHSMRSIYHLLYDAGFDPRGQFMNDALQTLLISITWLDTHLSVVFWLANRVVAVIIGYIGMRRES